MYENARRGLMKDMDKTQLLRMRDEEGMTINEIALRVGCSRATVQKILGPMTPEQKRARQALGGKRGTDTRYGRTAEGGYSVERKMQSFKPQGEEPEPVKAVLAVKKSPIRLSGAFMHYTICPGRELVEVETDEGRVLMQIPADKLEGFIEELTAIRKNIGKAQPMEMWG